MISSGKSFVCDEKRLREKRGNYVVDLFDPRTGDALRRIGPFAGLVLRLAFSPDGRRLAVGLKPTIPINNDPLRLYDVASGQQLASASGYFFGISGLAFGPNGDLYAMASDGARDGRNLQHLISNDPKPC
jgi:WD40 repeat protein